MRNCLDIAIFPPCSLSTLLSKYITSGLNEAPWKNTLRIKDFCCMLMLPSETANAENDNKGPHVQRAYFSSIEQSNSSFEALSLPNALSMLKVHKGI